MKALLLFKEVENMGLPLVISIIFMLVGILLWLLSKKFSGEQRRVTESLTGLFILFGFVMWLLAIFTNDPITDFISKDAQLIIAGLSVTGLSWKYYFDPMKTRINQLEVHAGKLETKVEDIDENVKWIKENLLTKITR